MFVRDTAAPTGDKILMITTKGEEIEDVLGGAGRGRILVIDHVDEFR